MQMMLTEPKKGASFKHLFKEKHNTLASNMFNLQSLWTLFDDSFLA